MQKNKFISLEQSSGGEESDKFYKYIRNNLVFKGDWKNCTDDGAVYKLQNNNLVFTTDSFVVDPIFFHGGDIGKLSFCGTVNDLSVMGADVLGLCLSFVIEEGFSLEKFNIILNSINIISEEYKIPIVSGDTKIVPKGNVDKIIINTSGIGLSKTIISQDKVKIGDKVIVSGNIGDHETALLSKRFEYETNLVSDCKPVINELKQVREMLTSCKDPTRGGLASILNEISNKNKIKIILNEDQIPFSKATKTICKLMGLNQYYFASEGRFVATVRENNVDKVLNILKKFNKDACVIGEICEGEGVIIKTITGSRQLHLANGNNIPRIC